jgi:hypothetical protein
MKRKEQTMAAKPNGNFSGRAADKPAAVVLAGGAPRCPRWPTGKDDRMEFGIFNLMGAREADKPARLAAEIATADALSSGRLMLGIGPG